MLSVVREYTGALCFPGTYCFFHKPHSESPARILYVFSDVFQLTELIAGRTEGEESGSATARGQLSVQKKERIGKAFQTDVQRLSLQFASNHRPT